MRIYQDKTKVVYSPTLGHLEYGPTRVVVKTRNIPVRVEKQPVPVKDYINFKTMSGNEILLNLDNVENLRNGELISGLYELSKRDRKQEFDWNTHPISAKCIKELKQRLPRMNAKNVIQASLILQGLRITDQDLWKLAAKHSMRLLHKY